jgi:pyrroline-5-carboxylate reductase
LPSILFIGAGRMAEAIFTGLLRQPKQPFDSIYVTNRTNKERLGELAQRYAITPVDKHGAIAAKADVLLLAMPPSAHGEVLSELAPMIRDQLIITVAAGIGPSDMEGQLPEGTAAAWIMPNTAAQVGASISLYAFGKNVSGKQKLLVKEIVHAIGAGEELSEEQIHNLTAITGSAPAFVYEFALQLEKLASSYGITDKQARHLVETMLAGSVKMLETGAPPQELRDQVTTPGGATEAGLVSLGNDQFSAMLERAVHAVTDHAKNKRN